LSMDLHAYDGFPSLFHSVSNAGEESPLELRTRA
jgi:hypothetical protein